MNERYNDIMTCSGSTTFVASFTGMSSNAHITLRTIQPSIVHARETEAETVRVRVCMREGDVDR